MVVVQVNAKIRNLLYNAIGGEEYAKISSYDTAKEMWDKLEVTYERTSKVKETRIKLLVHDYELFQMKEEESMEEMLGRFSKIIGDLKAFGKPYSSGNQVRKILRSLPTTWKTKVVTLESQDLDKLSYDELRGDLIALEKTHLKKMRQEEKKKIVPFKTITNEPENDIDDDLEALEDEISMVSRNMNELMRRYRNTQKKGKIRYGRVQAECPDFKRKICRGFNKNKSFGSWSDEDSSEYEEIANLCFMTILENDMKTYYGCWTDEDISYDESKEDTKNYFMARGETSEDGFGNPKTILILVELTNKDPSKLGYLKEGDNSILQEHHRKSRKGKWYLDSACSSHMKCDKNMFKEVTKINGGNVKIDDNSKKKIAGTGRFPFNNNCDITEVYLVDGLNYYLLSISQLCDSGYEVKFKKAGCAIEDELGKIILPEKRYENVYILDGIENLDSHIGLAFISDDP
ncbi:uncharacterized protein [Nicotiana tomentosiformis]|uniref:uncharacterized protein n=1 Tax=Nicotiana tomentosiformis TaxID=4098 RepID=UPI00388CD657